MTITAKDLLLIQKGDTWDQCNWIVPLSKALEGLTAEQAAWIPSSGGLSIWQLVNHMYYYNHRLLSRIQGITPPGTPADTNESTFGEPGDPYDASSWNTLIRNTTQLAGQLHNQLVLLQESDLEAPYMNTDEKWAHELARWMLHDAYHAGQIVLLRRQQGSWKIIF